MYLTVVSVSQFLRSVVSATLRCWLLVRVALHDEHDVHNVHDVHDACHCCAALFIVDFIGSFTFNYTISMQTCGKKFKLQNVSYKM
jgi:hypothetical protein